MNLANFKKFNLAFSLFFFNSLLLSFYSFAETSSLEEQVIEEEEIVQELFELGIEDLINVTVTSISRKEEKLAEAAAAIFVISEDDIRRSGATSIPEALRIAPGLHVARVSTNQWAITSRGFSGQFATKLLVLFDGRPVYTPLFSGVFWDSQDYLLDDISRIEVIRGPGATIYGANAVNGVINIITKKAAETGGGLVTAGVGTEENAFAALRYGDKLPNGAHYRVYGKYFDRDSSELLRGGDTFDDWDQYQFGFRYDAELGEKSKLTFQGDVYSGNLGANFNVVDKSLATNISSPSSSPSLTESDFIREIEANRETNGQNLLLRYTKDLSQNEEADSDLQVQLYYDRADREDVISRSKIDTVDLDVQHRFSPFKNNEFIWGARYRFFKDSFFSIEDSRTLENAQLVFGDNNRSVDLFSVFFQDEIRLNPKLRLILGSKFEINEFTGFEYQPSVKSVWSPGNEQTLWAAVSRVVRTPSRVNDDFFLPQGVREVAPGQKALVLFTGNNQLSSENILSLEIGYRKRLSNKLGVDIAAFYNELDDGISFEQMSPEFNPDFDTLVLPFMTDNFSKGSTAGFEVVLDYQAKSWWKLIATYSYINFDLDLEEGSTDLISLGEEDQTPNSQALVRSLMDLSETVELDFALKYVGEVEFYDIDEHVNLDIRLGWSPFPKWELSVVGQNLLESAQQEFESDFISQPASEIERGLYGQVRYRF